LTKAVVPLAALASLVAAGASSSGLAQPHACVAVQTPPAAPAGASALWGHIKSLTPRGSRFELRFDPALWLGGSTAKRAAAEDQRDFSNDYYVVDESHRLLTYFVPKNAPVTVITSGRGICSPSVSVSELAQILRGKNPAHRPLYSPRSLGYWIVVNFRYSNAVRSIDGQYQP
jgi:hypothetical protein